MYSECFSLAKRVPAAIDAVVTVTSTGLDYTIAVRSDGQVGFGSVHRLLISEQFQSGCCSRYYA